MAGSPRLAMPVFERRCMKRPMSSPAQCGSKAERDLEKARVHPIAIELDLVCPLITRPHLFHQPGELRDNPDWEALGDVRPSDPLPPGGLNARRRRSPRRGS